MKKNYFVVFLSLFFFATAVWALPIDQEKAMQLAKEFMQKSPSGRLNAPASVSLQQVSELDLKANVSAFEESPYYVFNVGDRNGFVIVSGEDKLSSIVGYADKGVFEANAMSPALKEFLNAYGHYVEKVRSGKMLLLKSAVATEPATVVVAPLVKTHWNQGAPYNNRCPVYKETGDPMYTGCVATAAAQIINYHKYPERGIGSNAYYNENYGGEISADFSTSTYD